VATTSHPGETTADVVECAEKVHLDEPTDVEFIEE